jgi:CelD/BcsL family acetyltransferase involved in cellulose biosynthesis
VGAHARLRRIPELPQDDLAAWRRLAADAAEPNPFYEPEMLLPAVRHLGDGEVSLLTVADGGDWLAAVPVTRRRRERAYPGPCVVNWLHPHCFLGTPLVRAGREAEAAAALLGAMAQGAAWAGLRELAAEGPVGAALRAAGDPVVLHRRERAVLRGRGPAGSDTLTSKARSELRRRGRRLGDELGAPPRVAVTTGDAGAEPLLSLEDTGWKHESGTSLLSSPNEAAFVREAAAGLGERLRCFRLEAGERTAAVASTIAAGDTEFLFKTAYDERLGRHAPGYQLAVATIDALRERPCVDSCAAPDSRYVNELLPDRREILTLAFPRVPGYRPLLGAVARLRRA